LGSSFSFFVEGSLERSDHPRLATLGRGGDNLIVMLAPQTAHLGHDSWSAGVVLQLERCDPARARNVLDGQVAVGEHVQHRHR